MTRPRVQKNKFFVKLEDEPFTDEIEVALRAVVSSSTSERLFERNLAEGRGGSRV